MNNKNTGFSLLELMITLVVGGILFSVAAPSFRGMIRDDRITSEVNKFVGALNFARGEAVRRGGLVQLCPIDNSTSTECMTEDVDWTGWKMIVFHGGDGNENSTEDDEPLQILEPTVNATIQYHSGDGVMFNAQGKINGIGGHFSICAIPISEPSTDKKDCLDDTNFIRSKKITIAQTGRLLVEDNQRKAKK